MTQQSHYWVYTRRKTTIQEDTSTPMFTVVLFTIARTWKQPRCPSTDEWIKMTWYIHTVEYYSAIERNKFESVVVKWRKLKQVRKRKTNIILMHIYESRKNSTDELICREGMESQMDNGLVDTAGEGEDGMN